ncbi:MAG: hypothetical protein IT385_21060 [Deltaproteobacteria bacterium]|nr:hypothetical protein [Deltaproteobacteria bacterium]
MTPDRRGATADLRRLARDIAADADTMDRLADEVAAVAARPDPLGDEATAYLAVKVHGWYTALETILERVARVVEGGAPSGPTSHQDLLRGSTLPLPGVRPAVLAPALLADLSDLLAFRHFFRHAYAVSLDEARMRAHATVVGRVDAAVRADLTAFVTTVLGWVDELEG